jgi:translation initiation factor 2 subunit 2
MLFDRTAPLKVFWLRLNPYKRYILEIFMSYEEMLEMAYKNVKCQEKECSRFEILKVSGHHEGTKTIITNFIPICNCIRRQPEHLMKFLNKELASFAEISGERLILARKLSSKLINEKIEKYVYDFVICSKCGKPDTEVLEEEGKLTLKCLACGTKKGVHKI